VSFYGFLTVENGVVAGVQFLDSSFSGTLDAVYQYADLSVRHNSVAAPQEHSTDQWIIVPINESQGEDILTAGEVPLLLLLPISLHRLL